MSSKSSLVMSMVLISFTVVRMSTYYQIPLVIQQESTSLWRAASVPGRSDSLKHSRI